MEDLPKLTDSIYKEIEEFEDYEYSNCIAYEMCIRNKEVKRLFEILNNGKNEIQGLESFVPGNVLMTEWSALFKTPSSLVLAIFWVKRTQRVHKTQRSWSKTTLAPKSTRFCPCVLGVESLLSYKPTSM
jgi:hypothetical protein